MDRIVTKEGELLRVSLADVKDQAVALWIDSFVEDDALFAKAYFNDYISHLDTNFFTDVTGKLVLMAFNTKEAYAGYNATLIEGIAVDKKFQGKGIMKAFMDTWIKELAAAYQHVFIQAYNWNVYKRYDFHDFCANNLWSFEPSSRKKGGASLVADYVNRPFTDMERSSKHFQAYLRCMKASGAKFFSYKSASLILNGKRADNVTYGRQSHLLKLFDMIGLKLTFLLPVGKAPRSVRFMLIEKNRLETRLLGRQEAGFFNYLY